MIDDFTTLDQARAAMLRAAAGWLQNVADTIDEGADENREWVDKALREHAEDAVQWASSEWREYA